MDGPVNYFYSVPFVSYNKIWCSFAVVVAVVVIGFYFPRFLSFFGGATCLHAIHKYIEMYRIWSSLATIYLEIIIWAGGA